MVTVESKKMQKIFFLVIGLNTSLSKDDWNKMFLIVKFIT